MLFCPDATVESVCLQPIKVVDTAIVSSSISLELLEEASQTPRRRFHHHCPR